MPPCQTACSSQGELIGQARGRKKRKIWTSGLVVWTGRNPASFPFSLFFHSKLFCRVGVLKQGRGILPPQFCFPWDTWQCLETVVTARDSCWRLRDRDLQHCKHNKDEWDSAHNRTVRLQMSEVPRVGNRYRRRPQRQKHKYKLDLKLCFWFASYYIFSFLH